MSWVITPSFTQWTPALISTALWLDAADASTVTTVSGAVSQWNDKSGNGRNATQETLANRPALTAAALNNKNVLTFANGNFLRVTHQWANSAFSFFVVFKHSSGVFPAFYAENNGSNAGYLALGMNSATPGNLAISRTGQATSSTNLIPGTTTSRISTYVSTGISGGNINVSVFMDGTEASSTPSLTSLLSNSESLIGASRNGLQDLYAGTIAEILLVPQAISTDTRQRIEGYLAHKWGLTANLPSDHPYKVNPPAP
jgi:hypothetical protein